MRPGSPLDAHVELVKQTRGHAFLQGVVRQNDEPCYSFSGTLKRIRERNAKRTTPPEVAEIATRGAEKLNALREHFARKQATERNGD